MKTPALLIALVLIFVSSPTVYAGTTRVNVENEVNNKNYSSFSSESSTKVNIHQTGEGTSSVTINGKEWKLEGPGEINVNESSNSNETPTPTSKVLSPTPTSAPGDVLGDQDSQDKIEEKLGKIKDLIISFLTKLSEIFSR